MNDPTQTRTIASERLLNAEEVAHHVGMTPNWIYSETRKGRIPHLKLGRYRRYRASAINHWLAELEDGPTADVQADGSADESGRAECAPKTHGGIRSRGSSAHDASASRSSASTSFLP